MVSKGKKAVTTGKRKLEETVSEGKTAIASGKRLLDETVFKGKTAIETGTRQIEEAVFEGKTGIATGKLEIEEMTSQALQRIRDVSSLSNAEQKKELQQRLAKFYQKHLNSAPISPLLSDKDERLDTMYVPPKVVEKDHKKVGAVNKEKGTPVTAYRQLFCTKGKFSKNVFIVGEAGMGKTSCAAMCALKWAKQFRATSTINEHNRNVSHQTSFEYLKSEMLYFDSDLNDVLFSKSKQDDNFQDDTFFKEIEFLFHFTLRDCGDFCNLTDMIRDKLINKLYPKDMMAAALTTMHSVLSHNTCVIIADGLDEWTHPNQTYCSCSEEDKVIPYLSPAIDATVLITSRPWKLSQQRVKDTNIDKYLNIEGTADMKLLIHNMLSSLNETVTEKKTLLDFLRFVDTMKLARLLSVPIISMFLVCLWFGGMHESLSVCGIYAYTIEMMLRRKTLPEPIVAQSNIPFPCCFQHKEYIQKYYSIVMEMAELAYTTLFLNDKTSSLGFTKADFLAQENLMIVLKSGILQETKTASLIRKSSSYSFIHKTVQEFLAAIYMSYHPKEFYRVFKSSYEKNDYMADVSQVFIFMCGLNAKLANEMSAMISNSMLLDDENFWSDTGVNAIQSTIISGYKEAQVSKVLNIQLSLFTFEYIYTSETAILDNLLWINKSSVRHISITNSSISQAKLQEVFSSSSDTLTRVELFSQHGKYDLSACKRLKQILISGTETTDIVLDSKPLTSLCLSCVSETVEKRIFHSLKHGSETLKNFVMESITNISLLCQSVSSLTHLHRLSIIDMDFSDHALIIPAFFTTVELEEVTLTARSLMGLVKWLENCPEGARCTLDKYYAAENTVGKEVYQYIQTRKRLNIKTKGETQIIERKKCKRKRTKCIVS